MTETMSKMDLSDENKWAMICQNNKLQVSLLQTKIRLFIICVCRISELKVVLKEHLSIGPIKSKSNQVSNL